MTSFIASYTGLFQPPEDEGATPQIDKVEIPLIQRDYAQGREAPDVAEIRSDFLDVLMGAIVGTAPVGLDFIYGDVRNGTLRPLDGQQRLTTLFLLHWYLAFRTDRLEHDLPWTSFAYSTRATAESFCERIVANPPPADVAGLTNWIRDQWWYQHTWRHDPTIQAMLVMIDAIDNRLRDANLEVAWTRLTSDSDPAVTFHVLPIEEMGAGDELYIKMNSRGKPLTPFENFKARFEKALEGSARAKEFAERVDGVWADVLWQYRGGDDVIDDEFARYFRFVTEVAEWHNRKLASGKLEPRAEAVFGAANPGSADELDFLFSAFDAWVGVDVKQVFDDLITAAAEPTDGRVRFFGVRQIDHFHACCNSYAFGRQRTFGWAETLTLYAVVIHRIYTTDDFARRLRVLRNLLEASSNELRVERMPNLVSAVSHLVRGESLEEVLSDLSGANNFNKDQIGDELEKARFLARHPELAEVVFRLEDHGLLRGSLVAFELDAEQLTKRADAFARIMGDKRLWPALTAALLATGDYSRSPNYGRFRFGSPVDERWWRELLTGTSRAGLTATSQVLATVLDAVADSDDVAAVPLRDIREQWLSEQDDLGYDWRYYLVKYAVMREGKSGVYVAEPGAMGFDLCMMEKLQLNGYYRDPYLSAVWHAAEVNDLCAEPWFMGYYPSGRWLTTRRSGTRVRCVEMGYLLQPPPEPSHRPPYDAVCQAVGVGNDQLLAVPQDLLDGHNVDADDRIKVGAKLLRELFNAGL